MLELDVRTQMDSQKIDQFPYFSDQTEGIIIKNGITAAARTQSSS
jgi:hypothetical protein